VLCRAGQRTAPCRLNLGPVSLEPAELAQWVPSPMGPPGPRSMLRNTARLKGNVPGWATAVNGCGHVSGAADCRSVPRACHQTRVVAVA